MYLCGRFILNILIMYIYNYIHIYMEMAFLFIYSISFFEHLLMSDVMLDAGM